MRWDPTKRNNLQGTMPSEFVTVRKVNSLTLAVSRTETAVERAKVSLSSDVEYSGISRISVDSGRS